MKIKKTDLLRYALWLGVLNTANANRKYIGQPTTWVFQVALNRDVLFLPELYEGTARVFHLEERAQRNHDLLSAVHGMMEDAVVNNDHYALYVAPVALAYTVSHPKFNIYKGDMAKIRLLGFGLDAISHSTTAFAFTNLVMDAMAAFRHHTPHDAAWRPLAVRAEQHSKLIAGALLGSASAFYETGEYEIHVEELRETRGDESKINMEWSALDTAFDLMSNTLGWLAAVKLRKRGGIRGRTARERGEIMAKGRIDLS